jgi:hypothetical protein
MQLTGLRLRDDLRVTHTLEITEEVLGAFWAAVRGQQKML